MPGTHLCYRLVAGLNESIHDRTIQSHGIFSIDAVSSCAAEITDRHHLLFLPRQAGARVAESQLVAARTQEMNASSSEERVYFCYMHSIYMALSEVIIVGAY